MAHGTMNLNSLNKWEWDLVLEIAGQYKRPPKRSQVIAKVRARIKKKMQDPEQESYRRIIRKLREASVTEPR